MQDEVNQDYSEQNEVDGMKKCFKNLVVRGSLVECLPRAER